MRRWSTELLEQLTWHRDQHVWPPEVIHHMAEVLLLRDLYRGQQREVRAVKPGTRMIAGVLDHLSIQCADVAASASFYDAVLRPLGGVRVMDFGEVIGYGVGGQPTFWLGPLTTGEPNREVHVAFRAADRAAVRAFFDTAVAAGAEQLHEPRVFPEYHARYYGAFVRDPDGNNVEAVCHTADSG